MVVDDPGLVAEFDRPPSRRWRSASVVVQARAELILAGHHSTPARVGPPVSCRTSVEREPGRGLASRQPEVEFADLWWKREYSFCQASSSLSLSFDLLVLGLAW